jgi:hypothetical protein
MGQPVRWRAVERPLTLKVNGDSAGTGSTPTWTGGLTSTALRFACERAS